MSSNQSFKASSCSVLTLASVITFAACTSTNNNTTNVGDSGTGPVGDSGTGPVLDSGVVNPVDSGVVNPVDASTACQATNTTGATMYARIGSCQANVTALIKAVEGAVLANATVAPYFAVLGTAGHDTPVVLTDCLVTQLSAVMQAPGVTYPGVGNTNTMGTGLSGSSCRNMVLSHQNLVGTLDGQVTSLTAAVFNAFMGAAGPALAAAKFADGTVISSTDLTTVANTLTGLQSQIVNDAAGH